MSRVWQQNCAHFLAVLRVHVYFSELQSLDMVSEFDHICKWVPLNNPWQYLLPPLRRFFSSPVCVVCLNCCLKFKPIEPFHYFIRPPPQPICTTGANSSLFFFLLPVKGCVRTCRLGHWHFLENGKEDRHQDETHTLCRDRDVGRAEGE